MTEAIIIAVCSFAVGALLGGVAMLVAIAIAAEGKRADERDREVRAIRESVEAAAAQFTDAEVISIERALRDRLESRGRDAS